MNKRWAVFGVCLFLAAIVWAVFGQTLHHEFVNFDDDVYVSENVAVAGGLSLKGVAAMFTHFECNFYHPLTMISLMLNYQLGGLQPGGYHLVNVLLHTLSVILLFLILRQMTGFIWRSALVAAVFAIHPLRVESVAWVAERKDVLSGVFFMLTIWAYLRYAKKRSGVEVREPGAPIYPARRAALDYGLVILFFALGLLSKSSLVTLPFVLLLLDYWPLNRFGGERADSDKPAARGNILALTDLVVEKIPLFALSVAASVVTVMAERTAIMPTKGLSVIDRTGTPLMSYFIYLKQMFYPVGLAPIYPFSPKDLLVWKIILALVLLAAVSAAALAGWRKRPYLLVGWLWYLGMLVPMIGIMRLNSFVHADRYTYLPQIGVYILLVWAATDLCSGWRFRRVLLGGFSVVILLALIFCAHTQVSYWRDSESLWTHTLACTTGNFMAHINLSNALLRKGKLDDAIVQSQMAVQINPDSSEAYYNLGNALLQSGNVDDAIVDYKKALAVPDSEADAHINLGNALLRKGNVDEAIVECQMAVQIKPYSAEAHINLGNALLQKGKVDEAIVQYQQTLQIKPDNAPAHNNLGNALLQKGNVDEAIAHFQKALQINPDYAQALNNLAWVLATASQASLRNGNRAVDLAQQANQLASGQNPNFLRTLAAADAETGRFGDAGQYASKAIDLARAAGQTDLVEELNSELKLYQAGLPFHQQSQ